MRRKTVAPTLVEAIESRNDSVGLGRATVPVALAGVSPASLARILPTPIGTGYNDGRVFGGTPKTAVETTALPKATASFRLGMRKVRGGRGKIASAQKTAFF
jgi:hypothetical protein